MININKEEVLQYLEQSIILNLYKKDAISKFNFELNQAITNLYDDFNPDYVEVVKPKPFFLDQASLEELNEIYKITALNVCQKLGLNLIENPSANYHAEKNDYVLMTHQYDSLPSNINNNIELKIKAVKDVHDHASSLTKPFENAAGGLLLFFNIEKRPALHRSLSSLFKSKEYCKIATDSILFGLGSESQFDDIKNSIQPDLLSNITPLNIVDLKLNNTKKLKFG